METSKQGKKYGLTVKVSVASLLFVQMTQAFANSSLSGIMTDFPDASATAAQTVINIATLIMIVSALVAPAMAKKMGYKTAGLLAMVLALVGGVAPAFFHPSIEVIIFERAIFGIGYGMVYALDIAACGEFWRGKETTSMVGVAIFSAGLAGIAYNLLSAALAPYGWEFIYYGYFIIVPFMAFYAVFMPQHSDLPVDEALTGGKARFSFAGLGSKFWVFIVCMALGIAAAAAFMNNISMIVVVTGIDTTGAAVGIIMTGFGAGLMVGGAIYPIAYRLLKRAAMPVFLLIDAVCFLAIMANTYYMTLIVCATIIGVVFGFLNAAWGDMANKKAADYPAASSSGASVFIAASGLAQFLSPPPFSCRPLPLLRDGRKPIRSISITRRSLSSVSAVSHCSSWPSSRRTRLITSDDDFRHEFS